MRGFAAVVEREVYERRLLGVVALFLGIAAVVLPAVPGLRPAGVAVEDLRNGMAFGFAVLLTGLMALFLGGSIIASDLAERRLGFYFARPLSGRVIWGGKIAAALALTFGAGLLVLAPAALVGGGLGSNGLWISMSSYLGGFALLGFVGLGLVFLLLAAHAASLMARARSPWILLDIVALALVAGLIDLSMRRLALEGVVPLRSFWGRPDHSGLVTEIGVTAWIEVAVAAAVLLALALSGALQVARGRTDLRRGHRVLSATLWGILLATAFLVAGFTSWVLAVGPEDLAGLERLVAAPSGHWLALIGPAAHRPGYHPGFLYDLDSGRSVRTRFSGRLDSFWEPVELHIRFSADGKRAVWFEQDGPPPSSPLVLYWMDLDRPGARPVRSTTTFAVQPDGLALSPDGRRVAVFHPDGNGSRDRLIVQETESGRLLASILCEGIGFLPRLVFTSSDRLRLYERSPGGVSNPAVRDERDLPGIFELDLAAAPLRLRQIGHMPTDRISAWSLDPAGGRALMREPEGLRLHDGRTGELLAQLGDLHAFGYFLVDGRIAVLDLPRPGQGDKALRILSPDGRSELRRFDFKGAFGVIPGDQPSPGLLRAIVSSSPGSGWDLRLLDLESGASRSLGPRRILFPGAPLREGSPRLTLKEVDGVSWFDPATFQRRFTLKGS